MATATYNAPDNDAEVVTMRGVRFFDGQSVELDEREHLELIEKLRTNQHFDLNEGEAFESPAPIEGRQNGNTGW